ncbi:MAG: hypothetical protein K8T26_03235 [Lentisphaerae bacterium]|nr:hypothetical protein [Lentisphaerota bacterium]
MLVLDTLAPVSPQLNRRLLLAVGGLALAIRFLVVGLHVAAPDALEGYDANSELIWIARNLAAGHGYASPFDVGDAPSAWLAPFVPALWALLLTVLGEGRQFLAAALGLNALASAASVVVYVAMLSHVCPRGRAPSWRALVAAGAIFSLWPPSLRLVTLTWYYAWQELTMAALCYSLLRWHQTDFARRWAAGLALTGIAAAYVNPSPLVLLPPTCLWLLWRAGCSKIEYRNPKDTRNAEIGKRQTTNSPTGEFRTAGLPIFPHRLFSMRRPALSMALIAATILTAMWPWMVRCHARLGRWMPMRSSFGVELRQGNNPDGSVHQNVASLHPALVPAERAIFDAVGEGRYTAQAMVLAVGYMQDHPRQTMRRTACRAYVFWCSDILDQWPWQPRPAWWQGTPMAWMRGAAKASLALLPLAAALITALAGWWRNLRGRWLFASLLVAYPIPYYLTHVSPEYAYAVHPYLLLYALAAVTIRLAPGLRLAHPRSSDAATS